MILQQTVGKFTVEPSFLDLIFKRSDILKKASISTSPAPSKVK